MNEIAEAARLAKEAQARIQDVIHGQDEALRLLLVALAAEGHMLLEGMPGVGKTTLAKTFSNVTGLGFRRVQLTPDLMPSDITGHNIFNQQTRTFELRRGPVFTNLLLADELNRTPPRTQAALLEVMEEHQATIEGTTHPLPDPFLVVATKNPIEVEGVYRLPEAELDRFMLHVRLGYPARDHERELLRTRLESVASAAPVQGLVPALRQAMPRITMHRDLADYLLDIVAATREHEMLEVGASPRAALHLQAAARAGALLENRSYVVPDDIKGLAVAVLGHRVLPTPDAELDGLDGVAIVEDLVAQIPVPVSPQAGQ